jgi:predicted PurR-regulated permease PerM
MSKPSFFIIRNIWWLVPLAVVFIFWEHTAPILLMLVFAFLGRIILQPVVRQVEKLMGNHNWSVVLVISLLLVFLIILSGSLFPFISQQITALQSSLSMETLAKFQTKLTLVIESILPPFLFNFYTDVTTQLDSAFSEIWATGLSHIKSFIGGAGSLAFALGSAFLSFLIIIVFMIIFLLDGKKFTFAFLHAVPGEHYGTAKGMLDKISLQIHAYIRGQLIAATSVGITSIIGLYILQWITGISIPYTILIGIGAGLFNLIPFVGPIAGVVPALILYLVTDQAMPIHIIYVLLIIMVFAIVQLIDNLVVSPYIMGGSVGLHPILVIILVLLGASVGGILGMLFVIPIAAILKVVLGEFVNNLKK